MIAVIDYGAGNIKSVLNAIKHVGLEPLVTNNPQEVLTAEKVVFPGVGAAASTMASLRVLKLDKAIYEYVSSGKPFLGICIGMQVLFDYTEENGGCNCLGIIPGRVKKLPAGQKIPHIGWNQVHQVKPHQLFSGIEDNDNFYFVHSYYAHPGDDSLVLASTFYGIDFCSAIVYGKLVATQFHPEKSGKNGLKIYENFLFGSGGMKY
ncbi:MAG: imidazole glycerol phosphate synthase subunit HisH [Dehalococcoidales bacterium]|jgi:glutamine amidotransferase|nr:imidazole glycerol phosphate synthase subunit HisH [Dehalococcoidales bacterium]MDX9986074.1 imidazole glycerol phosphate synthase subunit HisH [Dehalococcoidales bacterium]NLE89354.1 imidazole glycerol phosphate synthase subunit HisH [Dehalococcoidales bacterium]